MMGDVRTQLYVRVEPMQGVGGLGHRAICLVPRQPVVWERDYVLCSFPDTTVIRVWILISEDRFANIDFRISISEDRLTKIDFRISISEDRLANIDFQVSISKYRFPDNDFRRSIREYRFLKFDFQRSISDNRFLGIAYLSIIN